MSIGKQPRLTLRDKIRSSGFIVGLDTHLWRLQLPFWIVISNEYASQIVEYMFGIIERRTMSGIDYNGKPFEPYHNRRENEGAPVVHPYTYRSHDYKKRYKKRQIDFTRRPNAQKHNTSGTSHGWNWKKSGDKVTLHSRNHFGEGCWSWDFKMGGEDTNWAFGDLMYGENPVDGVFYFYPNEFNREARRKRARSHHKIKLTEAQEKGRIDLPTRARLNKPVKSEKRNYRRKVRNHPLWVLNFGRATDKQIARYPAMIKKWEERIQRDEDRYANPWIYWGMEKRKLTPEEAQEELASLRKRNSTQMDRFTKARSLYAAIREWKDWVKHYPKMIAEHKQKLEAAKYKAQKMKETNIRVPARKWYGFTDAETNQVIDSITLMFTSTAKAWENNVVAAAADASDQVSSNQLLVHDVWGNFPQIAMIKQTLINAAMRRMEGVLKYYNEADKAFQDWFASLQRMAGDAFQGKSGAPIRFFDTKQQKLLFEEWSKDYEAERNYLG